MIKNKAYQIPPIKKQETMVRRNKIKCKITPHLVLLYYFHRNKFIIYYYSLFIKPKYLYRVSSIEYQVKKREDLEKKQDRIKIKIGFVLLIFSFWSKINIVMK